MKLQFWCAQDFPCCSTAEQLQSVVIATRVVNAPLDRKFVTALAKKYVDFRNLTSTSYALVELLCSYEKCFNVFVSMINSYNSSTSLQKPVTTIMLMTGAAIKKIHWNFIFVVVAKDFLASAKIRFESPNIVQMFSSRCATYQFYSFCDSAERRFHTRPMLEPKL